MAHPDRPALPPPPPAMMACDAADMRAELAAALETVADGFRRQIVGNENDPGRRAYSGATVDAELAFALYREACRRGLHHSSIEAQAIADVSRFVAASDFASLDREAALERARIAHALAFRGTRIRVALEDGAAPVLCRVTERDGDGANRHHAPVNLYAERLDRAPDAGLSGLLTVRLDRFLVSWWIDHKTGPAAVLEATNPPPDAIYVRLHVGDPARRPTPATGTRRKAAASKSPARRRRKVG